MKTIYFMRHAKSDWSDGILSDHERPLNGRGRRAAAKMGVLLQRLGVNPEKVICSTATRASETLARVMSAGGFDWPVVRERNLYGASADGILRVIRAQSDDQQSLLLVGHNPGFEDVVAGLSGVEANSGDLARLQRKYPTGAFSAIDFDVTSFADIGFASGCLMRFIKPKDEKVAISR